MPSRTQLSSRLFLGITWDSSKNDLICMANGVYDSRFSYMLISSGHYRIADGHPMHNELSLIVLEIFIHLIRAHRASSGKALMY